MSTKNPRARYRFSIFWEEFGTMNEGDMEDVRDIEITRKLSEKDMDQLQAQVVEALRAKGWLVEKKGPTGEL